ncbi:hypothetical protein [uncultured Stenotrophomonas sp.]|uniref:hypothetical protein n=1 Tax=uncultured Stenotrophomonas sp. TaxID=165438 RepID=UPI0025FEA87D|nr:hypothetical protein [uncultured Stenotrophomonas sp.]
MKARIQAAAGVLTLVLALPAASGPVQDTDVIHAYCAATNIIQGRTYYSEVFSLQRRRYYDNDTTFAIAFAHNVDARFGANAGYERCWHDEQLLAVRMERDRQAAAQRRAVRPFEPVFVHWRP